MSAPAKIGRFEILETVATGVYRAREDGSGRIVAVRVLERPAPAPRGFDHPGIVRILDAGDTYVAMEWIEGASPPRGPMEPREAVRICADAADALQAAHDRGLVHGDLKPAKLLLDSTRRLKIAGLGLAPPPGDDERPGPVSPGHRSPEQLFSSPDEVDARTDVYSLGSVLYELLTGRAPFDDPDPFLALKRLEIEDPAQPGISKAIDDAVLRALAKDPSARFATARDFALALRAALPAPRRHAPVATVTVAAAALVLRSLATRPAPPPAPPRPVTATDARLPWLADAPGDPAVLFPAVRDLALRAPLETDPSRLSGDILGQVGPMLATRPASPGPYALMGVAHLIHGNRRLARDYFAEARARLAPDAVLGRDPVGALLAADPAGRFDEECARFLGGKHGPKE